MLRALGILATVIACALGAWLLILASVVYAGPLPTIGALLGLTLLAAWRGRDTDHREPREPTPGRERAGL